MIQAAAPADYRFAITHDQKLKKQDGLPLMVELVENPDIAAAVGKAKCPGQCWWALRRRRSTSWKMPPASWSARTWT